MTGLTRQKWDSLIEHDGNLCVSLYMPTHRAGSETRQDPIRFNNLLSEAEEGLIANGVSTTQARDILRAARALHADSEFWRHRKEGLAVFAAEHLCIEGALPYTVEEDVTIAKRFHVTPLLPSRHGDGTYFVLAVSLHRVRIFAGSRERLTEFSPPELKLDIDQALALEMERELQVRSQHVRPAGRMGADTGIFHGHEDVDYKRYIREYFQKVDDAVCEVLTGKQAPLVFAGVEYLFPIYQSVNRYQHLVEQCLTGNFDDADAADLHTSSWKLVEPLFQQDELTALNLLQNALGTDSAGTELAELLPAAFNGRIDCLFLHPGASQWGWYSHDSGHLAFNDEKSPDNEDLLNILMLQTLRNGGRVFAIDEGELPGNARAAALFRFAAVRQSDTAQVK